MTKYELTAQYRIYRQLSKFRNLIERRIWNHAWRPVWVRVDSGLKRDKAVASEVCYAALAVQEEEDSDDPRAK
jgi:hypothetical protein